jgi:nucleotide-binding universal stress UspA family protein
MIQEHSIDLIVIGTRGCTGAGQTPLGSVAERIFRQAPCAVLTVRPDFPSEPLSGSGLRHILYAADFTPQSLHAAPYAVSVAQGFQAQLTLLHVIQEPARKPRGPKGRPLEEAKSRLRSLIPEAADLPSEPDLTVGFGTPAARILDVAAEKNPDLIVLGVSQPAAGVAHPWATASEVVAKAACPVLTVRPFE